MKPRPREPRPAVHGQPGHQPRHQLDVSAALLKQHERFLKFLSTRLNDPTAAEDILQAAYLTSLGKAGAIRDSESAVAWFYRLLRNAVADHYRAAGRRDRLGRRFAAEQSTTVDPEDLHSAACQCVASLVPRLGAQYGTVLRRVELENATVPQIAAELGITPTNAGVRLHRARRALREQVQAVCGTCATHGCVDCSCRSKTV